MKKTKQIWIACFVLALSLMAVPPVKAEAKYTYTIRIYSGQQGTINGGEVMSYTGLNYGDRVNFNLRDVTINDNSKYYVKGIRQSGRDNNTAGTTSFQVTEDRDYVVAYGLLTDAVAYTINYVDAAGNTLAPSETYYGNVGDRPVIAYLYVEGYQPQAYNLTATLSENAAENIFNFVYTPLPEGAVIVIPGQTTIVPEPPVEPPVVPAGPVAPEPAVPGPGGEEPAPEPIVPVVDENIDDPNTPAGGTEGENTGDSPQEIVDLDDPDTPLGGLNDELDNANMFGLPRWARISLILLLIALIGGGVWYMRHRHKKTLLVANSAGEKEDTSGDEAWKKPGSKRGKGKRL